jgi:chromosome segregation ATPase
MKQKVEQANRDRDTFVDSERRLKELVRSLETEISHVSAGLMDRDRECERLENQLNHAKVEIGRLHVDNERFMRSSTAEDNEQRLELDGLRAEIETVNNSRVSAEAALETSRARSEEMGVELERLRRQLRDVKQQSADLEVKHIRLGKEKKQLEDDNAGLYIGLEAKQEELELVCLAWRVLRLKC